MAMSDIQSKSGFLLQNEKFPATNSISLIDNLVLIYDEMHAEILIIT